MADFLLPSVRHSVPSRGEVGSSMRAPWENTHSKVLRLLQVAAISHFTTVTATHTQSRSGLHEMMLHLQKGGKRCSSVDAQDAYTQVEDWGDWSVE